ncbi:oligosaccharide repeat unit polymerase [Winogradskyella sp. F6397]|uniref:Oligosaccharide repeat unit polymerase n=1 Tax=Winogradskyella marina TaxID=2785530 RepID=A0ABS0EEX1_9FLAO|nr:O-antigen polymerase [Winogradskyella marina]MBF8149005.1 oligosaccharide repeat unit polymerase [Winogradskyella marina]
MIWFFLILCLYYVAGRTKFSLFSPLVLFYVFFILSIVLSVAYHYWMPYDWKFNIAGTDRIVDSQLWLSIDVFVKMLIYFSLGVLFYKYAFNVRKNRGFKVDLKIELPPIKTNSLVNIALALTVLEIILVAMLYGKEIFIRATYAVDYNKLGVMLLEYSLLFLIFTGSLLYKEKRTLSRVIALFVTLLCIGFGSRMATIYLLVYFFVIFILFLNKKKKFYYMVFGIPFIILFFGYNLSLRFNDTHGLGPYLYLPFSGSSEIIKNTFFNLYYTLVFGVFATFRTLAKNPVNYDYLFTSLNPAPGFLTDWYLIFKKLRINHYAPYSGIGEIFTYPTIAFFFYFTVGMIFSHAERIIQKLFMNKKIGAGFILFLLTSAFIPFSFEYNLRSSVRFLYYAMIFMMMLNIFSNIKIKR